MDNHNIDHHNIVDQIRLERFDNKLKEVITPEQYEEIYQYVLSDITTEEFDNKLSQ